MRSLKSIVIAAGLVGFSTIAAEAQGTPSAESLLNLFKPSLKGIEYEIPTDAAVIAACKVETVRNAKNESIGYSLRDGQGKLLRKFLDTNSNRVLDQWSYYQDGFEVYRESDLDNDKSLDECRWLNSGGSRIAVVKSVETGPKEYTLKIMSWKRISAEEASKVFVQSLVVGDIDMLQSVLASPKEMEELGVPKSVIEKAAADRERLIPQVKALQHNLKGWTNQTTWSRLDGLMPHLIPQDSDNGLTADLVLYENAVIFAGSANPKVNPGDLAFLQAPEIVKLGESWKFVELPHAVDPKQPLMAAEGGIRSAIFGATPAGNGNEDPELAEARRALAKFDGENANADGKEGVAKYHVGRIRLLNAVVKLLKDPDDKLAHNKMIVDSLAAAFQSGLFPAAPKLLDQMVEQGGKIGSYAAFRKLSAEFALHNDEGANLMENQKKWMADLRKFVEKFPAAEETPEVLLQLASANEFNADEEEARKYYEQLAKGFATTDSGKKAAGALKRLDIVGKPFALKAPGVNGEMIDTYRYRGKPLLVAFWASWADPVKRDVPDLVKAYKKRHEQGFEIIGVCLDEKAADLEGFLRETPLPWPQIFVPGGLEKNPYASEYGIIALPTMFLIDGEGKVVSRSIRTAAELEKQLDKLVANKDGVALGR